MRHFRYWAGYVLRFRAQAIVQPLLDSLLYRFSRRASFESIKIVAPPGGEGEAETRFLRHTVETLRLIQAVDPRRFRRLQREVAIIDDRPLLALGAYSRPGRRCSIDFARYEAEKREQDPEWFHWIYATTLVHEATHGAVYSRHVSYTRKTRVRIERLCCMEARRFATRADREDRPWSDTLAPPFDEERWHESWHSTRWQKTRKLFARYQEVSAAEKSKKR